MFENRFKNVLSRVEIESAISYPLCNRKEEIIFFYKTSPIDGPGYRINEIRRAVSRNNITGAVSEIPFEGELLELTEKCRNEAITFSVMDDEALELEDSYYELYEKYYDGVVRNSPDPQIRLKLLAILNRLIPDSNLRKLYFFFGKDYFEADR